MARLREQPLLDNGDTTSGQSLSTLDGMVQIRMHGKKMDESETQDLCSWARVRVPAFARAHACPGKTPAARGVQMPPHHVG